MTVITEVGILLIRVYRSLWITDTAITFDSALSIERAHPKPFLSTVDDQQYCLKLLKEQNEHIKTFCNLLGEARGVMLDAVEKYKYSPSIYSGESKEIASLKQSSNNTQILNNEIKTNDQCSCANESTQVNYKNDVVSEKDDTFSDLTTSETTSDRKVDINAHKYDFQVDEENLEEEIYTLDSLENPDQCSIKFPYMAKRNFPIRESALATISERTEKSTTSEVESVDKASDKPAMEMNISNKSISTDSKCVKGVKPLKDRATEVVISTIISKIRSQSKSDKPDTNQEKLISDTASKSVELSLRSKLSIHTMPAIDIRRGLVTQTIPTIVINPSESIPQNVLQDSNVAYEIVKHLSNETINTAVEPITSTFSGSNKTQKSVNVSVSLKQSNREIATKDIACDCSKQQSNKCVQTKKIKAKILSKGSKVTEVSETEETESYHSKNSRKVCPVVSEVQESEHSSVKKMYTKLPATEITASVETVLKVDMPVTTFVNKSFQAESESEVLIVNNNVDVNIPGDESEGTGSARKSFIGDLMGKQECVKEFINEMIKDPTTEFYFKSYQVVQEQSGHDPGPAVNQYQLSLIDTDVYKTYVNPEGLEYNTDLRSDSKRNVLDKYMVLPVTRPEQFYSTKATQCAESTQNIPEDRKAEEKKTYEKTPIRELEEHLDKSGATSPELQLDKLSEKSAVIRDMQSEEQLIAKAAARELLSEEQVGEDDISQNTTILNFDGISQHSYLKKHHDTGTLLNYKEPNAVFDAGAIVQDPSYVSRISYELPHSLGSRTSPRRSRPSIPPEIQKGISSSMSSKRSSHPRKSSQASRMAESLGSHYPMKCFTEHSQHEKSAPISAATKIEVVKKTSEHSNSTEDVILEINREKLRSKSYVGLNSRKPSEAGSVKDLPSKLEGDRSVSMSEYVITHDVSLQTSQTSATDAAEEVLNVHQFSTQNLATSIEKLKIIVEEDIRNDPDVQNITCCSRFRKKNSPKDVYVKSLELDVIGHDNRFPPKNVKLEEPEKVPLVHRDMTLSLPARVFRRLSRRNVTPVQSFIEGLTSHNKDDIMMARTAQPQNDLAVLEEYNTAEIVQAIKQATDSWRGPNYNKNFTETSSHTSDENINIQLLELTDQENDGIENTDNAPNSLRSSVSNVEAYTIMPVQVEHPEDIQIQDQFSMKNKEKEKSTPLQKNVPGGDEACNGTEILCNNNKFYPTSTKHEGIFPRYNKPRQKQKIYESSSSSEAPTILESITEKTDGNLSEGEVKCNCSASIGEIHVCPFGKNNRTIQHLKKNPKKLLKRELGSPNIKINWQKEFNSNWVAYYVSRISNQDNTDSLDETSTDSSGVVRK